MIKVCEPFITKSDINIVEQCVRDGFISNGKYIELFEKSWAKHCHKKYGVTVCNGTVALQLAIEALDIKPGDQIIIPSFTIISCVLAVIRVGAIPVLVDVDDTWCLDPDKIIEAITSHTKAIMVVHMYGQPANMDKLCDICSDYNLYMIEDAAQAHGATWGDKPCGSFGTLSCFSFYGNKLITTGEGGMILTDSLDLYERIKSMRNLCFGNDFDRFNHVGIGYNFRMTNFQAALGYNQSMRIGEIVETKIKIGEYYRKILSNIPELTLQQHIPKAQNVYWMNGLLIKNSRELSKYLYDNDVETRPFFTGLHQQKILNNCIVHDCSRTENLTEFGLYLPSGLNIEFEQIDYICDLIRHFK